MSTSTPISADLAGQVLQPGDAGYDAERRGYNLCVEHHPAVIHGVAGVPDVIAAVRYATERGLPVAVQATGHGPTTPADGGVLINTARMDTVRVDPVARTARVAAGVRSGYLVTAAAAHGLAPVNGSAPGVGAVSYHLGGGVGLLGRRFGYASDHVRALEVVTADGRLHRVTAEHEQELFWALRGGGKGRFGVVVALEIDLHPVSRLYGGGMHFGPEATAQVLHTYAAWAAAAPEDMGSSVLLIRMPDLPSIPGPLRGRHVSHVRFYFTGSAATGAQLVAPFRALGPLTDTVAEMPYREVGAIHAEPTTPVPFYARNSVLKTLDARTADTLLTHAGPDAAAPYLVELRHLAGALARPAAVPSAMGRRDGLFSLYSGAAASGDQVTHVRAAMARLHQAMAPWSTGGVCLNFLAGPDVTAAQVRSAYLPQDLTRLDVIENEVDPSRTFRANLASAAATATSAAAAMPSSEPRPNAPTSQAGCRS